MTGEELQAALSAGLGQAINAASGGFVTRWVTVVETISPEGQRELWHVASDDCETWDVLGLLAYATASENACVGVDDD